MDPFAPMNSDYPLFSAMWFTHSGIGVSENQKMHAQFLEIYMMRV
ncbi:hypothetical protein [Antarcticimicrobium luteum]|nr:hypothetical protein [Antarcticimicrobium luteum]